MNKNLFLALSIGIILNGCASMMPERTTAVKRATETKEYDVSTKELITASIGTFQDLGYTIDVLNAEFGLITASKTQGTTTTRTNLEEDPFEAFFRALTGIEDNSDVIISPLTLSATITVKEISTDPFLSSLRVNFEGGDRKFSDLFFKSFFAALDKSLFFVSSAWLGLDPFIFPPLTFHGTSGKTAYNLFLKKKN